MDFKNFSKHKKSSKIKKIYEIDVKLFRRLFYDNHFSHVIWSNGKEKGGGGVCVQGSCSSENNYCDIPSPFTIYIP